MIFRITAKAEFDADNIDDALHELGCHFLRLYYHGVEVETIFRNGKVTLESVDAAADADQPDAV
jgi:hypothetical protein